jgi:hypothetical protein
MVADASFVWTSSVIVLAPVSHEDLYRSIIHFYWDGHFDDTVWYEKCGKLRVKRSLQKLIGSMHLSLCGEKWIIIHRKIVNYENNSHNISFLEIARRNENNSHFLSEICVL